MVKKLKKCELKNSSWWSGQKVGYDNDKMAIDMTAIGGNNKPGENENDEMKGTKRTIKVVNVAAVVDCTGLLIKIICVICDVLTFDSKFDTMVEKMQ